MWRYVSKSDLVRLSIGNLSGSFIGCILIEYISPAGFPRPVFVLDLILCLMATSGLRGATRITYDACAGIRSYGAPAMHAVIYGAGDAGVTLLHEIQNSPRLAYRVSGFLDDNPKKKGRCVAGVPVLGSGEDVRRVVRKHYIEVILIAAPSATGAQMTRILEQCYAARVKCKTALRPGRRH